MLISFLPSSLQYVSQKPGYDTCYLPFDFYGLKAQPSRGLCYHNSQARYYYQHWVEKKRLFAKNLKKKLKRFNN
jgi:hypothetical protein